MSENLSGWLVVPPGVGTLHKDDLYRLLSSKRRRLLIDVLNEQPTPMDLEELALMVAKQEQGGSVRSEAVQRVAITLHHNHLPKLADVSIIEYRPESNRVETFYGLKQ